MKLLRALAGYNLYDHKTNNYIRRELRIKGILDKTDEYRRNWLSHLQRMPRAEACNTDTTPTQPHRNSNTHRTKNNMTNVVIQQNSRRLLMMDDG